jgi:hypothetical protein
MRGAGVTRNRGVAGTLGIDRSPVETKASGLPAFQERASRRVIVPDMRHEEGTNMTVTAVYHNGRWLGLVRWSGRYGEEPVHLARYFAGPYFSSDVSPTSFR